MIAPSMQIRPHAMIIDVGITALRHAQQNFMHAFQGTRNDPELSFQFRQIVVANCVLRVDQRRERWSRLRLDCDVDNNKPFFVDTTQKILYQHEVAERYGAAGIDPSPVIQSIGSIGEHWWAPKLFRYLK